MSLWNFLLGFWEYFQFSYFLRMMIYHSTLTLTRPLDGYKEQIKKTLTLDYNLLHVACPFAHARRALRPGSHPPSSSVLHRTTSSYINASSSSTRSSPKLVPHTSEKSYPSQRFLWKRFGFGYEMQWLNHKGWGVIPGTRTCCWRSVPRKFKLEKKSDL